MMQKSLWMFIFLKKEVEGKKASEKLEKMPIGVTEKCFLPLQLPNLEVN